MTPPCANCNGSFRAGSARMYVRPDGSEVLLLCRTCRSEFIQSRQYKPTELPAESVQPIEGGTDR